MGVLADFTNLIESGWGWLFPAVVFLYEVVWPFWQTRLQSEFVQIRADMRTRIEDVRDHIVEMQELQKAHIQVTRAQARSDEDMDAERVDEYLVENGVEPSDFLHDSLDRRNDNNPADD